MIANIVICLLALGFLSLWKLRRRYDNAVATVSLLLLGALLFYFVRNWHAGVENTFLLLWDSSASGDIKISINSSPQIYNIIFPFFTIVVLALFNNLLFRFEKQRKLFSALIILILSSFILLISGDNFVQVVTFVFVIDILSQVLVQDIYAGRRYGIYNLAADMGLFLIFALMRGKLDSLDMTSLVEYYNNGKYQNLIVIVMMLSLFIKFGFFIFHSYLLDLKSAKFHRLILIPYMSTPAVALILFVKLKAYLVESALFCGVFNAVLVLTLIWGAAGAVVIKNLKEKTLYFSMMIMALLARLAAEKEFVWNVSFSLLLICGFCFNCCLYYLHYYTNRNNTIALSAGQNGKNLMSIYIVAGVLACVMAAFYSALLKVYPTVGYGWFWSFVLLFMLAAANMFTQVLKDERNKDESLLSCKTLDYRPLPFLTLMLVLSVGVVYVHSTEIVFAISSVLMFIFLLWLKPIERLIKDDYYNNLQNADFFSGFYDIIIARPIKFIGRILTLMVDFVFLEKTLVSTVMLSAAIVVRGFRQISREGAVRYVLFILTAFLVLAFYFLRSKI